MDCFALGPASVLPILSADLFIAALQTSGREGTPALSTLALLPVTNGPLALKALMVFSVMTGWGGRFDAAEGAAVSEAAAPDPLDAQGRRRWAQDRARRFRATGSARGRDRRRRVAPTRLAGGQSRKSTASLVVQTALAIIPALSRAAS